MPDEVRIGLEPTPEPPPRSGKVLALGAGLLLLAAAAAWLVGAFTEEGATTTLPEIRPPSTTTTTGPTTTLGESESLAAARRFWAALGAGDASAAAAAFPGTTPEAADLIGFAAAFRPAFTVEDCTPFAANAVQCRVVVGSGDLRAIGIGTPGQRLTVATDGWFEVPALLGTSAARLSLYALEAHGEELHAACPLNDNPQVLRLAIVGSATAPCGTYLAGLIPEYLSAVLHLSGGPPP